MLQKNFCFIKLRTERQNEQNDRIYIIDKSTEEQNFAFMILYSLCRKLYTE